MLSPLDEYPIHQTPLSMAAVATSDRNFYDRCYFNGHDRTGDVFLITGMGIYPNVGVVDGYLAVKQGERVSTLRFSDALGDERLRVGPYRIEVIEPLQKVRVICEPNEHGIAADITWDGSFPALEEQPHVIRKGPKVILQSTRFAQVGTWTGTLSIDGVERTLTPDTWLGSRDRSWGIRPLAPSDPANRFDEGAEPSFWWLYVPLRFDDFSIIVIMQEGPDGYRTLNDATSVWPDGRIEQLGWPRVDFRYRSGSRIPLGCTMHCTTQTGDALDVEVESLGYVPLHLGPGYGDADWSHGDWRGHNWSQRFEVDLTDPAVAPRIPFGNIDHVARATCRGPKGEAEGFGLFEHATVGRHDPTGFADVMAVAP